MMDTSYFGSELGLMLFRDHYSKTNLYWKFVKTENIFQYKSGIALLQEVGYKINAIVCDGKRGLLQAFTDIPVQMCQFHQVAIVRRYITRRPKLEAAIELKKITAILTHTDKESFKGLLTEYESKWKSFLNEKTTDEQTCKWHYTHKRLRSALRSLKTNLPYLFTWYDYMKLGIPNTTNSLEGTFSNLKTKVRVHSGLKMNRKIKLINQLLSFK